jgi:hypothetical protein
MIRSCILLAVWLGLCGTAAAETVTLQATKDNTLYENLQGTVSNGAGPNLFVGTTGGRSGFAVRRALVAFDIAANIPAGAQILSVQLVLNMDKTIVGAKPVGLHRVLANWGEGTSLAVGLGGGGGGPATTGDATWLHRFFDTELWTTPGGDFASAASAQIEVTSTFRAYTWGSTTGMVADVQSWLDQPASNFGWILIGDELNTTSAKRFASRQNPAAANRPHVVVQYVATAIEPATWTGIKQLYR